MTELIEIFPWNKNFETGIAEIDEQHQMLVSLLNTLASHLGNKSNSELLHKTFDELADYAAYHFESEECIWNRYFPNNSFLKGHLETHSNFISSLHELKAEEAIKPIHEVVEDLLSFLTHWLAHHILDSDMRMSKTVLAMKSGLSLESAQQQADKEMAGVMGVMLNTTLSMYDHLCNRTLDLKREINERIKTENKLSLALSVFDNTLDGICITDANNRIISTNPAFSKITGYSHEEIIGQNPAILSSGKQSKEFYADMWETLGKKGYWQGEVWNCKKDGKIYPELLTISQIVDEKSSITHYIGMFRDITIGKLQQEKLEMMAHYDVLTQLPNRMLLVDRFARAVAHSNRNKRQLAVCFLDLDHFKPVNDNYGHETGDQLLIEVANRITKNIRDEDTVSRQGGDEFVLLLGGIESLSQCENMLERIIQSLAQPYYIEGQLLSVSASIGVSLYPIHGTDFDTLLRHADQAMYQAKLAGRSRYSLFDFEQDQKTIQKNNQLQEIQQAFLDNEFCLYYQPKVNMKTGEIIGAEALIRWIHSEKGVISPLDFLPLVEGTELEFKIGNWVISEALKQLDECKMHGHDCEFSVNVSSRHLLSPSFISQLEASLALYPEIGSNNFQLEILESSALGDIQSINSIIKTCYDTLGVTIALDDFGTGYSSLTHLRNLPVKTIKIDQSFVRDMLDDPNDFAIIDGVIGLATAFNREMIAEGVETIQQGLMLLLMGCNLAQGYSIAKPMPASDLKDWFNNYTPNQEWVTCGNNAFTSKQNKLKVYWLALNQWRYKFEKNMQSSPDRAKDWPQLNKQESFCNKWIKRAKQEQLIEEHWLLKFDEMHDSINCIADNLVSQYQEGSIEAARDGLEDIRAVFKEMNNLLEECE